MGIFREGSEAEAVKAGRIHVKAVEAMSTLTWKLAEALHERFHGWLPRFNFF